jgi:hypothetical protein
MLLDSAEVPGHSEFVECVKFSRSMSRLTKNRECRMSLTDEQIAEVERRIDLLTREAQRILDRTDLAIRQLRNEGQSTRSASE